MHSAPTLPHAELDNLYHIGELQHKENSHEKLR
jgi:hypothetical protein